MRNAYTKTVYNSYRKVDSCCLHDLLHSMSLRNFNNIPHDLLLGHFDSQGQGEQAREIILEHLRSRVREPESGEGIAYRVGYYILRIEAV